MTVMTRNQIAAFRAPWRWLWTSLARADGVYRQRQALAKMTDHMLDDIGISRTEALTEAAKPLWDVPQHWLK